MYQLATSGKNEKVRFAEELLSKTDDGSLFTKLKALAQDLKDDGERELAQKLSLRADAIRDSDEHKAVRILGNKAATPGEMFRLGKTLANYNRFGPARMLMDRALRESNPTDHSEIYPQVFQKYAVYTYKDPDLPVAWRLDRALKILKDSKGARDLLTTEDQETLGIAGAIYKRKWEIDGQRQHLERALSYYLKGYAQGAPADSRSDILGYLQKNPDANLRADDDRGYNGINAAFILDLLAYQEEEEAKNAKVPSDTAERRREHARRIREEIVRSVPPLTQKYDWLKGEWWFYATVGEAFFGLGDYKTALDWLVTRPTAAGLLAPEWEYESTARQLTRLALLKHESGLSEEQFEQTSTGHALKAFLKDDEKKLRSAFRGKFGLALSGGGFRASLYHIGVLAKLAELDALRHVEALSCVSGGSIVGAYYYLELRRLYHTRKDEEIKRQDYVDIVKNIEKHFLEGVQRNIRTRILAEFTTNVKLLFWPGYSRTKRVGELYERELFSRVEDEGWFDGPRWLPTMLAKWLGFNRTSRYLTDLYIHPCIAAGERDEHFYPKHENWKRKNKIPTLILNATSLNTGHVWQFTASYMGEPPDPINNKVDNNFRLRRMYYKHAPDQYKKFRLGYAVAASSGVPGLFEPLILDRVYPQTNGGPQEEISVKLVDGGVYDNQGIAGLLEQDCSVLLVSDASGQTESENVPSSRAFNVLWRANNISMARVRSIQYKDVAGRKNSSLLRGLMYVHLKQELPAKAIAWKTCPDHLKSSEFEEMNSNHNGATSYEISTDIQSQLAAVRTDLDSFSEAEAYALMASGYNMTGTQFEGREKCIDGFTPVKSEDWEFLKIRECLHDPGKPQEHLNKLLGTSSSLFCKVWKQWFPLIVLKWVLAATLLLFAVWAWQHWYDETVVPAQTARWLQELTVGRIGLAVLGMAGLLISRIVLSAIFTKVPIGYVMRVIRWRDTLTKIGVGLGMCLFGWLVARLHLHVFDRLFLWHGKLERFPKMSK
jgi:predicted acylesterase/phospholipase RssA